MSPEGRIAQTTHPRALGSALTHPYLTTDYSEALLEFITPPFNTGREALQFLHDTHRMVYEKLGDELLWANSMPCVVAGESSIPIAQYGHSNLGLMKTVYRRGLGHRYGRMMQVIAGVHFNYSFAEEFWAVYQDLERDERSTQDFVSDSYFALIRNLQRLGWIIPYLFGASPAVCKSFIEAQPTALLEYSAGTYYEPYATSLRMADIGYQNSREDISGIKACYDNLYAYVDSLTAAVNTPYPAYEKIGLVVDGEFQQLNANILQIENEYYSSVRPKQVLQGNEPPARALRMRGVQYIELRSLDVNPFEPVGIAESQMLFLEALLLLCLLSESPLISTSERRTIDKNQNAAAHRGRAPGLPLQYNGETRTLSQWGTEICEALVAVCDFLDQSCDDRRYSKALGIQHDAVREPERTPSARVLNQMEAHREGFFDFAKRVSEVHRNYFRTLPLDTEKVRYFDEVAALSLQEQQVLEQSPQVPFDEFLREYYAQR